MSGTVSGGKKARDTNIKLYGKDWYAKIGTKGGSAEVPKGFAINRELASSAGYKGGIVTGAQYKTRRKDAQV